MSEENKAVTVAQAIERLQRIADHRGADYPLMVAYDPGFATAGGTRGKSVLAIMEGFDWDARKVWLDLGTKLATPTEEFENVKKELNRAVDTIGWVHLAVNSKILPHESRVKAIKDTLVTYSKREKS